MPRFKNPTDERIYQAFRAAFRAAGLSRAQLEQAVDWYETLPRGQSRAQEAQSFQEFAARRGWDATHIERAVTSYDRVAYNSERFAPSSSHDDGTIARAEAQLKSDPAKYFADQDLVDGYSEALERREQRGGRGDDHWNSWEAPAPGVTADSAAERQAIETLMRNDPKAYWGSKEVQDRYREILAQQVAPGDPMNPSAGPVDLGAAERPDDGSTMNGF